jgi:hypothetical protein
LGTALGGRTPLYIVDGMPTENININDITLWNFKRCFGPCYLWYKSTTGNS